MRKKMTSPKSCKPTGPYRGVPLEIPVACFKSLRGESCGVVGVEA